ncbi:hypothetical protein Ddc_22004 [Ditylenchus destructor]|nr:hypothetical protein Ddc_22004 [Ditylenchus destructor]
MASNVKQSARNPLALARVALVNCLSAKRRPVMTKPQVPSSAADVRLVTTNQPGCDVVYTASHEYTMTVLIARGGSFGFYQGVDLTLFAPVVKDAVMAAIAISMIPEPNKVRAICTSDIDNGIAGTEPLGRIFLDFSTAGIAMAIKAWGDIYVDAPCILYPQPFPFLRYYTLALIYVCIQDL